MIDRREHIAFISDLTYKAADCGVSDRHMQAIIGTWPLHDDPASVDSAMETVARRLHELFTLARAIFAEDATVWLHAHNRALSYDTPVGMMVRSPAMVIVLRDMLRDEMDR